MRPEERGLQERSFRLHRRWCHLPGNFILNDAIISQPLSLFYFSLCLSLSLSLSFSLLFLSLFLSLSLSLSLLFLSLSVSVSLSLSLSLFLAIYRVIISGLKCPQFCPNGRAFDTLLDKCMDLPKTQCSREYGAVKPVAWVIQVAPLSCCLSINRKPVRLHLGRDVSLLMAATRGRRHGSPHRTSWTPFDHGPCPLLFHTYL